MAGDESYILKVRVATPSALEDLLARMRAAANVSTRTTIVLSTPYESRPLDGAGSGEDRPAAPRGVAGHATVRLVSDESDQGTE